MFLWTAGDLQPQQVPVQGPPGTGKTRTLLVLLRILCRLSASSPEMGPILACADTNAATDNILDGLVASNVNVVRLGRPSSVHHPHMWPPHAAGPA